MNTVFKIMLFVLNVFGHKYNHKHNSIYWESENVHMLP